MSFRLVILSILLLLPFSAIAYGGEEIVFFRGEELWSMDITGGKERFITKETMDSMSMSSNGKIVFQKTAPYDRGEGFSPGTLSDIYLFDIADGGTVRLTDDKQSRWPEISSDGKNVIFEAAEWKDDYGCCGKGIWLLSLDDRSKRKIMAEMSQLPQEIKDSDPSIKNDKWSVDTNLIWAKDGEKISFLRRYTSEWPFASFLLGIKYGGIDYIGIGRHVLDVYKNKVLIAEIAGDSYDYNNLYLYDLDSSKRTMLQKNFLANRFRPTAKFAPTGDKFLFLELNKDGEPAALWVMSSDGRKKKKVYRGKLWSPQWDTEGKKIAFCKPTTTEDNACQLSVIDADGSGLRVLTDNSSGILGWINMQGEMR